MLVLFFVTCLFSCLNCDLFDCFYYLDLMPAYCPHPLAPSPKERGERYARGVERECWFYFFTYLIICLNCDLFDCFYYLDLMAAYCPHPLAPSPKERGERYAQGDERECWFYFFTYLIICMNCDFFD